MKTALTIFGVLLILVGGIWVFQGINVIKGSYMTGRGSWALSGGIAVVAGLTLLALALKRKTTPRN